MTIPTSWDGGENNMSSRRQILDQGLPRSPSTQVTKGAGSTTHGLLTGNKSGVVKWRTSALPNRRLVLKPRVPPSGLEDSQPRVDGLPSETPEGKQRTKQANNAQGSGHHGGSLERLSSPTLGC